MLMLDFASVDSRQSRHWGLRPGHWALRAVIASLHAFLLAGRMRSSLYRRYPAPAGGQAYINPLHILSSHASPVGTDSRPTERSPLPSLQSRRQIQSFFLKYTSIPAATANIIPRAAG